MDEQTLRIRTLARLPGFGARRISSLVKDGGVDELIDHPRRFAELIGEPSVVSLENRYARVEAEQTLKAAAAKGQSVTAIGSPDYPASLAAIYDPPPVLFYRGSLASGARRVAIVGARGATPSGRSLARDLARGLSAQGIEVVSGLARGIDGSAHEGALSSPSTTLAVL